MGLNDFRMARGDAKREAVLRAARSAFAARGFAESSTLDIANRAGVSTATLYRHFPTKLDLFAAVLSGAVAELRSTLARGGSQGLDALCAAYATLLSESDTRSLVRLVITSTDPTLAQRFYETGKAATSEIFTAAVAAEIAAQKVSADADAGQLMGMIEHPTLMLGLLAGDDRPTVHPPEIIAARALETWRARFGRPPSRKIDDRSPPAR